MNGDRFDGFFDNGTKTNRGVIILMYLDICTFRWSTILRRMVQR